MEQVGRRAPDDTAATRRPDRLRPEEIALNRNSSEGLSTAIFGIPLKSGDQVLISPWDYPSANAAWFQRQCREGIEAVTCRFDLLDSDDDIIAAYASAITPRMRVMQLTHMCHWNGRSCRSSASVSWRGSERSSRSSTVRRPSHRCLSSATLVTTSLSQSLYKWLSAPIGTGMLIVKESQIDRTSPPHAPFDPPPHNVQAAARA